MRSFISIVDLLIQPHSPPQQFVYTSFGTPSWLNIGKKLLFLGFWFCNFNLEAFYYLSYEHQTHSKYYDEYKTPPGSFSEHPLQN
jgi:hypothetical protein